MIVIGLELADRGARGALVPAQAGDPGVEAGERPLQGLHLAHVAAGEAGFHRVVEEVGPAAAHQRLDRPRVGKVNLHLHAVAPANLRHQVVGLLGEAPGVESDHPHRGVDAPGHVQEHHAFGLERGHDGDPRRKPGESEAEDRSRPELFDLVGVERRVPW